MNKLFVKLIEDEPMYTAIREYVTDLERPKHDGVMSMQDYGALCVAFDTVKKKVNERFDDLWREGEDSKKNMV